MKWATVCSDRRKGGLGVRRLHPLNKELVLCVKNGGLLETNYLRQIWGNGKGLVLQGSEKQLWHWVMEGYKEVVGFS